MLRNIKLTIEYDGAGYAGWQFQPGVRTIQATIEKALGAVLGQKVRLTASGRTDAGVHAKAQVANFRAHSGLKADSIKKALNARLPQDIAIKACQDAGLDFNARFDAKAKLYRYTILNSPDRIAINRQYAARVIHPLNIKLMRKEAKALVGRRNFKSFHASGRKIENFTRQIKRVDIKKGKANLIYIDIEADGFLYNMARNIVGTLVKLASGRQPPSYNMKNILKAQNRRLAGPTMPAKGLCLMEVKY